LDRSDFTILLSLSCLTSTLP